MNAGGIKNKEKAPPELWKETGRVQDKEGKRCVCSEKEGFTDLLLF